MRTPFTHDILRICTIALASIALCWFALPHTHAMPHAADQTVTNCSNDSDLRNKLTAMQGGGGGGTLTFACGTATILLSGVLPTINTNTTINGGNTIEINGNDADRVFILSPGATLTLNNLTITHGHSNSDGGAIYNNN